MAKRLACFMGQITQDYQGEAAQAIRETAQECKCELHIFTEFGSYGENFLHAEGEKNIINLPYLQDYDGIIVALDTFDNVGMDDMLIEHIQKYAQCPIVSLRQESKEFHNVIIDDRFAMADMIEHYITVHHFTRICFMTGRMEMEDARKRLEGYKMVMEKYGLPIDDHMVFEGDYWRYKGEEAVEFFLNGEEMPQAIACSNDYMALAVCDALKKRGYRIPEDIAVSGFDDIDEARYADPKIASVRVPAEKMGREAVLRLLDLIEGKEVDKKIVVPVHGNYRGTCGCGRPERGKIISELHRMKEYMRHALMQNAYMNVDFENCNTTLELLNAAYDYARNFAYDNIFIVLCEHYSEYDEGGTSREKFSENVVLRAVMSGSGLQEVDEHFKRRDLLPSKYKKEGGILYFWPLHYKTHCMGYIVLQTEKPRELREFFQAWLLGLSSFLDKVSLYEENQVLLEFRRLSVVDDLTGLSNRRCMEKKLITFMAENRVQLPKFYLLSIDMDGLKYINDTYGHAEGDVALCCFAEILNDIQNEQVSCARMGGDEFQIFAQIAEEEKILELIDEIQRRVEGFNKSGLKPYPLSCSIGYAAYQPEEELAQCIQRADANMYVNKARKKNVYKERGKLQ